MYSFYFILGALLWIVLALWPAILAKRKGYSFILFFLLAIVISWLLALVVSLFLHDRNETSADKAADKAAEAILDEQDNN